MTKSASYEFRDLLDLLQLRVKYDINVAIQATIKKYDPGKNVADVVTAVKDKGGIDDTVTITECPVLASALLQFDKTHHEPKYIPLKKGEKVMLLIDNRNMDNFTDTKNKPYQKDTERMHDINDAVVIGRHKVVEQDD